MNETLDLRRLGLLMRGDLVAGYRTLAIVCATLAALMLLGSLQTVARIGETPDYYQGWYLGMLFIWGAIGASLSFYELHDKTKNEAYLLLPASALEKTLARLLRATVGFVVFLLIFLTVTSLVIEGINLVLFGRHNGVFNPSHGAVWVPVGHFIAVTSVFFLGAAWFRRLHFIKTALTLAAIPIVLVIIAGIVGKFLFEGPVYGLSGADFYGYYTAHETLFDTLLGTLKVAYFVLLPVFCWVVAWLRLKETQSSDGV